MNNLSVIEIFANCGLVINGVAAIVSLAGAFLLFIGGLIKLGSGWSENFLDRFWYVTVVAFVFGVGCQIAMYLTNKVPPEIGLIFRFSPAFVNLTFFLSLIFILLRISLFFNRHKFV